MTYLKKYLIRGLKRVLTEEQKYQIKMHSRLLIDAKIAREYHLDNPSSPQSRQQDKRSLFRFEVMLRESQATGYRNSLSVYDGLQISFEKIFFYNCGAWGQNPSDFFDLGELSCKQPPSSEARRQSRGFE